MTKQVYTNGFTRCDYEERYPVNLLHFPWSNRDGLHPTAKSTALLAYLIRTYTNPGDTILDNTMGSGSTGVACIQERRNFIGIEMDAGYFEVASGRIANTQPPLLFDDQISADHEQAVNLPLF